MNRHDNPYAILGVTPSASVKEIRAAYRKAALQHHPDKNKSAGAHEQFARISAAYEMLTTEQQPEAQMIDSPTSQQQYHHAHCNKFHDPFAVFEQVFREEFGTGFGRRTRDPFERHRSMMHRSIFDEDHFSNDVFAAPFGRPFGRSPFESSFFGGSSLFGDDTFSTIMRDQMNSLNNGSPDDGGNSRRRFYSGSSSSTSTTRSIRNENGKISVKDRQITGDGALLLDYHLQGDPPPPTRQGRKHLPWWRRQQHAIKDERKEEKKHTSCSSSRL